MSDDLRVPTPVPVSSLRQAAAIAYRWTRAFNNIGSAWQLAFPVLWLGGFVAAAGGGTLHMGVVAVTVSDKSLAPTTRRLR